MSFLRPFLVVSKIEIDLTPHPNPTTNFPTHGYSSVNLANLVFSTFEISEHLTFAKFLIIKVFDCPN